MASRVLSPRTAAYGANRAISNAPQSAHSAVLSRRAYATGLPPADRQPQTKVGTFYKSFGSPVLKCFLGALFTYQVVYWGWMKLENVEEQKDKEDEIADIKNELKALVFQKREAERLLAPEKDRGNAETVAAEKPKKAWW